jgi:hypothetical protein
MKVLTPFIAFGLALTLDSSIGARVPVAEEQSAPAEEAVGRKKQAAPPPAVRTPPAPLRFTDEDLEKYRRPAPPDDGEATSEEIEAGEPASPGAGTVTAPAAGPAAKPGASKQTTPQPRAAAAPKRPPIVPVTPPAAKDPLKPFRDREAKERFRQEQLQRARDRITQIQERLDYLNARKAAVLDPLRYAPPPASQEERQREASVRPQELLDRVEADIKDQENLLLQARNELVRIETRFERETSSLKFPPDSEP